MQRTGPDSLEGCLIALTCCLISTMMYGTAGLSSMLFVACMTRYNTDRNQASFPFILNYIIQATTGPLTGYLANKFSVRCVVMVGSFLGFIGIGTCFFAESITAVTILWGIILGTGFGFSTLLLPVIINSYFVKHRSKALGISFLGSPLGFFIFPPIFEILYNEYGLSGTFLFLSAISMHCIPLSLLLRQPNFKEESSANPSLKKTQEEDNNPSISIINKKYWSSSENEIMTTGSTKTSNSYLSRYSLEFLWKQPLVHESSVENINRYDNLRNRTYSDPLTHNDNVRSFEKITENYYENIDYEKKTLNSESQTSCSFNLKGGKHSEDITEELNIAKGQRRSEPQSFDELNTKTKSEILSRFFVNTEAGSNLLETDSCSIRKLEPLINRNNHNEYSTIYYGTIQNTNNVTSLERDLKCQPNYTAMNDGRMGNNHAYNYQIISPSNSSCKTSEIPFAQQEGSYLLKASNYGKKNCPEILTTRCAACFKDKSLLNMYINPVFILMSVATAIFNLQFSTLTTVIIDFARDHSIEPSYDKFIMMCLSVMGACGMLGFGWVTDGGYMKRNRFASLCLLIGSITTAVLPQTVGFVTLMIVLAIWCVSQSCFVLLVPAIIAEYFAEDIQTVAVTASSVLCGPLYLIIPPLIGYFRDGKGSYDGIFYLLSSLSLLNSIAVFCVSYAARRREERYVETTRL